MAVLLANPSLAAYNAPAMAVGTATSNGVLAAAATGAFKGAEALYARTLPKTITTTTEVGGKKTTETRVEMPNPEDAARDREAAAAKYLEGFALMRASGVGADAGRPGKPAFVDVSRNPVAAGAAMKAYDLGQISVDHGVATVNVADGKSVTVVKGGAEIRGGPAPNGVRFDPDVRHPVPIDPVTGKYVPIHKEASDGTKYLVKYEVDDKGKHWFTYTRAANEEELGRARTMAKALGEVERGDASGPGKMTPEASKVMAALKSGEPVAASDLKALQDQQERDKMVAEFETLTKGTRGGMYMEDYYDVRKPETPIEELRTRLAAAKKAEAAAEATEAAGKERKDS